MAEKPEGEYPTYIPSRVEQDTQNKVLKDFILGRNTVNKSYNQFNGRNLYECIDDWTKRWNGYIPEASVLLDADQSRIFLNFTRNQIISYLSKAALQRPEIKIKAVNKKTGMNDQKFSEVLKDLNQYSLDEENGEARFTETAIETTTKGTAIVYEGYARNKQKIKIPDGFDIMTGKGKFKEEERIIFDNCYQQIVPLEDLFIPNAYQPNIQKQPFLIWRSITTHEEASIEFGHYKNWQYVKPGSYTLTSEPTTFYRNDLQTELKKSQVEILRYYNKYENQHVVLINGVVIFDGPIPFKDGNYPFSKYIFEPYANDFFWGAGFPQKIMGEQDLLNTMFNMMVDKTYGSLLPFGLSSDLDDWIEDDVLTPNKIRKVGDINKWKFQELPGINAGEQAMLQTVLKFANDNSGITGGGQAQTARGGKLNVRQVLLQQQEAIQKMGFSMNFLEDGERDRTVLRINHILQFYSIPKVEKITGKSDKEIQDLTYRDVRLSGVELTDGKQGNKVIKLISHPKNPDERQQLSDQLSVTEAMGEETGTPTEALALDVDTFYDYNLSIQVVKNSSYEKNAALDQAARMEFANWRIGVAQIAPLDTEKLVAWVEESFDVDADQFKPKQGQQGMGQPPGMPPQAPQTPPQQGTARKPIMPQLQPTATPTLQNI